MQAYNLLFLEIFFFFFVPMVQILCHYIIIDTIRCRSDVICNGIVSKQNTRLLYVSSMVGFWQLFF